MIESFLILWSGGVMCAAAIPRARDVTLQWLRLAGILALTFAGLSLFFWTRRDALARSTPQLICYAIAGAALLVQLALVQTARPAAAQLAAVIAFNATCAAAYFLAPARAAAAQPVVFVVALAGVSAMTGIVLMDMLLGHAYLTASRMTMAPFRCLNLALALALAARAASSVGVTMVLNARQPVDLLWPVYGLYILTRWLVGLLVPAVFVYMAHDCIKRRSTQSATGILYVAGVLIFIGEIIGLYLLQQTGLPF